MTSKNALKPRRAKAPNPGHRKRAAVSADPLYLVVARALKEEIVSGVHPVGSLLPTEGDLCERFSVSRHTVREALRLLRDDNLVASRQGSGTIVTPLSRSNAYAQDVMSINDLVSWSRGKTFEIMSMEMIELSERTAARTGLKSGEKWLAVFGLGLVEGEKAPVCWAEYYINQRFAAVGRLLARHQGPIFPLIEDMFGQRIVEVHQDIGATLLSPTLANALKAKAGSAALEVRRAFKTAAGEIAQATISTYPAPRYQHSMTLRRVKS